MEDVKVTNRKNKSIKLYSIIAIILILALLLAAFIYFFFAGFFLSSVVPNEPEIIVQGMPEEKKTFIDEIAAPIAPIKEHTNFLAVGVDSDGADGSRTDTIMIGCFNATEVKLDIISIPRDTYVEMPEELCEILREEGPYKWVPAGGVMKINEVHHYAGDELGIDFLTKQIEHMFEIDIEYYLKIDFEGLHFIVDSIGGIEFDVPQRMIYDDPEQNLHIDLYPGLQMLDGDKAEQLLRYRHGNYGTKDETPPYPRQDLDRVEIQQAFLTETIKQVLSKENIIGNLPTLAKTYIQHVETNFNIADTSKYLRYAKDLQPDSIYTHTLLGTPEYIDNRSYFILDEEKELIDEIFHGTRPSSEVSLDDY